MNDNKNTAAGNHVRAIHNPAPAIPLNKDPENSPRVTLIIPTYNRRALLEKCLQSVFKQDYTNKRIVIVDDGSTDGTSAYLSKRYPGITFIRNQRPLGPSFARNQGINETRSEFLYFLDSDSELVYPDTISEMLRIMDEHSDIGMLGGIGQPGANGALQSVYGKKVTFDGRSYPVFIYRNDPGFIQGKIADCDYVETCNCFVRTEAVRRIGGFNPYYVYMGEDKELGIRVKSLNYRCCFGLHIACLHAFSHATKFDRPYTYLRGKMHFAIRNRGLQYLYLTPLLDLYFFFFHYPAIFVLKRFFSPLQRHHTARNTVSPNARPPQKRWLLMAPYFFAKAYLVNVWLVPLIIKHRNTNFLLQPHMDEYRKFCRKRRHD